MTMSKGKTIRCSKCRIEMSARQFVIHRTPAGEPCRGVPCLVCGGPVGADAWLTPGGAVCSQICERRNRKLRLTPEDAIRDVDDQLAAMRRAEALPLVYQRRRAG
jgi:hypothetical protein